MPADTDLYLEYWIREDLSLGIGHPICLAGLNRICHEGIEIGEYQFTASKI